MYRNNVQLTARPAWSLKDRKTICILITVRPAWSIVNVSQTNSATDSETSMKHGQSQTDKLYNWQWDPHKAWSKSDRQTVQLTVRPTQSMVEVRQTNCTTDTETSMKHGQSQTDKWYNWQLDQVKVRQTNGTTDSETCTKCDQQKKNCYPQKINSSKIRTKTSGIAR